MCGFTFFTKAQIGYDATILEIIDVKCYEFYSFTYTSNKYCKINISYFPLIGSAPFAWLHFIQ